MSFNRRYIGIDGPGGSGKTLLIERLLESSRTKQISAVRFLETESIDKAVEERGGNGETRRYSATGADGVMLCRYPPGQSYQAGECFWNSGFLSYYDPGTVIVEGRGDFKINPDFYAYITRPLADNEPLFSKQPCDAGRLNFKDFVRMATGVEMKEDPVIYEDGECPEEEFILEDGDEIIEEEIIEVPDDFLDYIKNGVPIHQERWCLNKSHAKIIKAKVALINIHEEAGPAAEDLAAQIRRVYEDEEVYQDIVSGYSNPRLPSIFIANLADRKDSGLKKAVARIKRLAF